MSVNLNVNSLLDYIRQYSEEKDYAAMLEHTNILLAKDPDNGEYLLYKLKALEGLGKATSDIKFLHHYIKSRSTDITGYLLLYRSSLERDDVVTAIFCLVFSLSIEPDNEQVISLLLDILQDINPEYKRVKINVMTTSRIGHLSCEIEPLFRSIQDQPQDCLYIFLRGGGNIANQYLFDLLENFANIIVDSFWMNLYLSRPLLLNEFFLAEFPYDNNLMLRGVLASNVSITGFKNLCSIYNNFPRFLKIPEQDITLGWQLLANKNLYKEDKLVCLHVRDSAYLSSVSTSHDFSYHDFRDAKISSYQKSIEHLLSQGYKVIRIGANTNQRLELESNNYFDFCLDRDEVHGEFLEVFMLDVCQFFIANFGGPYGVAAMLDTPTLVVNGAPIQQPYMKYGRFIPKRLFQGKEEINLLDVCADKPLSADNNTPIHLSFNSSEFENYNYHYLDNSEDEILQAVVEFEKLVENRVLDMSLTERQEAYYNALPDSFCHKNKCVITDCFLKQHEHIFQLTAKEAE